MNRSPRIIAPLALALLALPSCGGKDSAGGAETNVAIDMATTGTAGTLASDDGGMTVIDAATGDAGSMPADYSGPTAYDLNRDEDTAAPKAEAPVEKANEAEAEPPPAPETPPAAQ